MTAHGRPEAATFSRLIVAAFVLPTIVLLVAPHAEAISAKERRLTNTRTGISVEAPGGWTLSQHAGYADTIALLVHPDGSRISVTVTNTTARDAQALYEENRAGLSAEGLLTAATGPGARGSWSVDLSPAKTKGPPEKVRQLYLVRTVPGSRQAIILTLVCSVAVCEARVPALEFVATRLGLEDPLPKPGLVTGSARGDATGKGAGGSNQR
jgi:hypothetical protein